MTKQVNLLVTLRAKQDKVAELKKALEQLAASSSAENGCLEYRLGEASEGDIFFIKECWADEEALTLHGQMTHYVEAGPVIDACCESVDLQRVQWKD